MSSTARVVSEIRRLHTEFQRCFRGDDEFDSAAVEAALADDFILFPPNGGRATTQEILTGLGNAFGSRQIEIRVENIEILWHHDEATLVGYEEWHAHADYETARRSTALLIDDADAPGTLVWQHVHETWIQPPPGR